MLKMFILEPKKQPSQQSPWNALETHQRHPDLKASAQRFARAVPLVTNMLSLKDFCKISTGRRGALVAMGVEIETVLADSASLSSITIISQKTLLSGGALKLIPQLLCRTVGEFKGF